MNTSSIIHANAVLYDTGKSKKAAMGSLISWARYTSLLLIIVFLPVANCFSQITITLSTPAPVGAAAMCPGDNQQTIYAFTLVASGIPSLTTQFTALSFTQSGTATGADISRYKLWSGAPGGTLVATNTLPSFSGFSNVFSGLLGTTINYWITADIPTSATAGRTIIVNPLTTADFTTTTGLKTTFGTIAAGGAQTVLLAPTAITGVPSACVSASTALGNGISGGVWTSSNTAMATIDASSGILTGVTAGNPVITYKLSTGCLATTPVAVMPLPAVYSMTGGGGYCAGGVGAHVGLSGSDPGIYYQLYAGYVPTGDPEGTGAPLDFGLQTAPGAYTSVATNMPTGCSSNMAGFVTVNINTLPTVYMVTGGGAYCSGGAGLNIGLSGSQTGVTYRLYRGVTLAGLPKAGTGSALDFGIFTTAGNYTITATNDFTGCRATMAGGTDIIVNPLPLAYNVTGGGSYCDGGAGVHVRMLWSQIGIVYVLYNGSSTVGIPVAGTGLPLDFGLQTAPGIYTITAIDATTGCTRDMPGSAIVTINPLPVVYTVTGGGNYCYGGDGLRVGLSSSDEGIMYLLYNGSTIAGDPVPGTGVALDLGAHTAAGIYTVVAVNSMTTCMRNMYGSAAIIVNPLPVVYAMTGGGSYCAESGGVNIGISNSDYGISYQLYHEASPTGISRVGTGAALNFGLQTPTGDYTVSATNIITGCTAEMSGSSTVIVSPLPAVHHVTGGGYYCENRLLKSARTGYSPLYVGLDGSDRGVIYLLYRGGITVGTPMAGTGNSIDFGVQYGEGVYTVTGMDAATLCTKNMAGNAVISYINEVTPTVSINTPFGNDACEERILTYNALITNGGDLPRYVWKVNGIITSVAPSFSYIPGDGDEVDVMMTSNTACANPQQVTDRMIVNAIAPITPTIYLTAYPGTDIMKGEPVTFTAIITDGGMKPVFQWFVNGFPADGVQGATFITSELFNNDNVSCLVTRDDACGMSASGSLSMIVTEGIRDILPDGNTLTVIPNPNNGTFTVKGTLASSAGSDVFIDVTNMLGQVIYSVKTSVRSQKLNQELKLENVAAGVYILNVRTASEKKSLPIMIE